MNSVEWSVAAIRVRYVVEDTDRHGTVRLYLRKPGLPEVRLSGTSGSPEARAVFPDARAIRPAPVRLPKLLAGSVRLLTGEYFKTTGFLAPDPKTRKVRRGLLGRVCDHAQKGSAIPDGDRAFAGKRTSHVLEHPDRPTNAPAMATALVKPLRNLFAFAVGYNRHDRHRNPAADVEVVRGRPKGWYDRTMTEIDRYEARHPIGPARPCPRAEGAFGARHERTDCGQKCPAS